MKTNIDWENPPKDIDWSKAVPEDKSHGKWIAKQLERSKRKPFPTSQHYGYDVSHGKEHFIGTTAAPIEKDQCHLCGNKVTKGEGKQDQGEYTVHQKCPPFKSFKQYMMDRK